MSNEPNPPHRCWAEIDRAALRHNLATLQSRLAPGVGIMAVVKANAYGHGVEHIVPALAGGVAMFGVANLTEAKEVQALAPKVPVFILGPALPWERREIVSIRSIPSISSTQEARAFADLAQGAPVKVHLIVDTGMGRIGVWHEQAAATVREIAALPGIQLAGMASHFPVADEDPIFTHNQIELMQRLRTELHSDGVPTPPVHFENSAGILAFPAEAGDLVRPGLALYGSSPLPEFQSALRPVLTWKTRISLVRDVGEGRTISYGRTYTTPRPMRIATLTTGYADGYQRHLSNHGAEVLIRGRRCPVLGRVTMDQILADVSPLDGVEAGEESVLLGRQGDEEISAAELARKAGTIPWEIVTGLGRRVERVAI